MDNVPKKENEEKIRWENVESDDDIGDLIRGNEQDEREIILNDRAINQNIYREV